MNKMWIVLIAIAASLIALYIAAHLIKRIDSVLAMECKEVASQSPDISKIVIPERMLMVLVGVWLYVLLAARGTSFDVAGCVVVSSLLWVRAFVDGRTGILPDSLTGALLWMALIRQTHLAPDSIPSLEICAASVGAYLVPVVVNKIHHRYRGFDAIGMGDAKLLAGMVLWFGPASIGWILFMAIKWCVLYTVARSFIEERAPTAVPMGPFFALAGNIWMLKYV